MKIITPLIACLSLGASLAHASSTETIIGRYYLAQKNLPYANSMFAQGSDAEAKTLKALTSLALLQRDSSTVTFLNNLYVDSPANIWDARDVGYSPNPSGPNPFRAQNNANANQISSILKNSHLPVYLQAETDLTAFTSDTLLVPLGRSETGYPDISLDRGDVLMIRALLACGRGAAYLINSQNSSILINEFMSLTEEPGPVTIEKFLAKFVDAGKLANPSDLPLARQEFKNAITLYKEASEWIRIQRPNNAVRLFNLPGSFGVNPGEVYTAGLAEEAAFRAKLDEYALLLDGSRLLTGFDNKPIDTLNAKPFFDGLVNLRSILPSFRKNKIRQGDVTDAFAKAGGIYPGNTIALTEGLLQKRTADHPTDPYVFFGLFVPPSLSITTPTGNRVTEGYTPSSGVVSYANRTGDVSEPISVLFSLNGTANNGLDYTFPTTPVSFQPGNTQQPIPFGLVNDNVIEFDETVVLTGTPNPESDSTFQPFTLTIQDDDGSGVGIVATDNVGKEGRMNPDPFGFRFGVYDPIRFEVRRTGSTVSAISVKVSLDALLSSASTDDYQITGLDVDGQSVRIPAGSSSAEIVVSPKYDINYPEGTESLTLKISPDPAYTMMEYSSATGSIVDSSPYEWWSYQMGVLISNQSPSLDTDKDGMPNLLEMALGRDPNLPDSPNAIKEGIDSEGYLTLTYKRWTGGITNGDGSYTQYGVTYRPQASSTLELADWSSSPIQVLSTIDTGDGMEEVVVRDTQSKSLPRRFLRLQVVSFN